ncbi:hypothetical protein [Pectobacterium sp. B1J-3]|uniref:hypothetical protein n=1 Tax=Pectobacterium sp. B1J-3 TaxID=3385371 RepID=UPI0039059BA8
MPALISSHYETLKWPDLLQQDFVEATWLPELQDRDGDGYDAVLIAETNNTVRFHIRHKTTGCIAANLVLTFNLTAPSGFPSRLPQVESVYVAADFRAAGLATLSYCTLIEHYGALASDTHQTYSGMSMWLNGIAKNPDIELFIATLEDNNHPSLRLIDGRPESYIGNRKGLLEAAHTVWHSGRDVQKNIPHFQSLGITLPSASDSVVILLAKPATTQPAAAHEDWPENGK